MSDDMAGLARRLGTAGTARTGDGGLDGLIAGLLYAVTGSIGGVGMSLQADSTALIANQTNYLDADHASVAGPSNPFSRTL